MTDSQALRRPLTVVTASPQIASIIQSWARTSFRTHCVSEDEYLPGTLLIRTSGEWDSLICLADFNGNQLTPVVLFKNPVPLWQQAWALPNGVPDAGTWRRLRRSILIHNPGLGGLLELADQLVLDVHF